MLVNITDNNNAMPICGKKFKTQINQVFPIAPKKVLSANKRTKFSNPIKWLLLIDNTVASVKLSANVLKTGYKPKMRKPRMKGRRKKYPVEFFLNLARFMLSPS
jgi:ribosomal protein L28